ncbi:MAG: phosphoglycerate dehydrogenase [Candidatus Zixiibacteriota bacterium]
MTQTILIADKIADDGIEYLKSFPEFAVQLKTGMSEAELCDAVRDCTALVVRSASTVSARVIESAPHLSVIGRAGIGVDNIDIEAATERGIVVLNTPDANATTTAELTIAHLLSLSRNLPAADQSVREGRWERNVLTGVEVAGKTLGIIGYGTIGRLVAKRAKALEMIIVVHDPYVTNDIIEADGGRAVDLESLLAESDYVTLHAPVTPQTRSMIGARQFGMMKRGARFINCARGALVDEDALIAALESGHLAGAAVDVYAHEPPEGSRLLTLSNVVFTPHLGASTREAQVAAGMQIATQIATFLRTGEAINAVNVSPVSREQLAKLKPFQTLARALGRLLTTLAPAALNRVEITLAGGPSGIDVSHVATETLIGILAGHHRGPVNQVNAAYLAKRQGLAVVESRAAESSDYHTLLQVTGRTAEGELSVAGTLFDERYPRLVRIDDLDIEAILEGHLLISRHRDQPGVVAGLSNAIADANINITRMHLGPVGDQGLAVAVIGLDQPLPTSARDTILALETVIAIHEIDL